MPANEWYKQWFNSTYYHQLYFSRDESEAQAFIQALLAHLQPAAGSRMLDAACGKGRHSRMLAARGFDITGIDLAPESISHAKEFEQENLQFFVHDLRLPFRINYFDYVFNFFTSFGYFATRREHDDAVHTMAASLKPGGLILFDYLNVHYIEDRLVHNEVKTIDGTQFDIHRWHNETHFFKKITVKNTGNKEPLVATERVSKFSLGDFTDMLSFQKLQVTEVFGDYNLCAYDIRKTPRMIVIAKK